MTIHYIHDPAFIPGFIMGWAAFGFTLALMRIGGERLLDAFGYVFRAWVFLLDIAVWLIRAILWGPWLLWCWLWDRGAWLATMRERAGAWQSHVREAFALRAGNYD